MGELVIFVPKTKRRPDLNLDDDVSEILEEAIETAKQSFGRKIEKIFWVYGSFENLLRSKITNLLMTHYNIDTDLFRCSLYVSGMLEEFLSSHPESFYATHYFSRGHDECNPDLFKKGGDMCFLLCTFFEGRFRKNRHGLKLDDYLLFGSQLYFAYHAETKNSIGYCMGKNFREIVSVTRQSIRTI